VRAVIAADLATDLVRWRRHLHRDDCSAYGRVAPGCFFVVGAGGQGATPHGHPRFTIDEDALPVAHDVFVRSALDFLRP
jgi:amidohydrolase